MNIDIEIECAVATYDIRAEPAKALRMERLSGGGILSGMEVQFAATPEGAPMLISRSKPRIVKPDASHLEKAVRLLLVGTDEDLRRRVLMVSRHLGMVTGKSEKGEAESLISWSAVCGTIHLIFAAKSYLEKHLEYEGGVIGRLDLMLLPAKNRTPRVVIRPSNLREALILKAAQMKADGVDVRRCLHCKKMLTDKRASAKFCCDECRADHWNAKRKGR